jgi:transposase
VKIMGRTNAVSDAAYYRTLKRVVIREHAERSRLTDAKWKAIGHLFPPQRRGGRWRSHRQVADAVLVMARGCGACWRDLPPCCGPWQTIYWRFRRYQQDGTLALMLAHLSRCGSST